MQSAPNEARVNPCRRFGINVRAISAAHKNKLSTRFAEVDRLFVCRKTKTERGKMGKEFEGFVLIDVYSKTNHHKVAQKYGQQLSVSLLADGKSDRKVSFNEDFVEQPSNLEEDDQEEKLLDEQKMF